MFLTCGQLNLTPKIIAVQIPHRVCLLSKYTHHRGFRQNLHVFILWPFKYHSEKHCCQNIHITETLGKIYTFLFCGHLNITAKNSSCPNLHTEMRPVKYHNVNVIQINYPGLCYMVQKRDVGIIQLPGGRNLVGEADISFVFLFRPLARAAATERHSYSIIVILPSQE
jgi:hypothetical protein